MVGIHTYQQYKCLCLHISMCTHACVNNTDYMYVCTHTQEILRSHDAEESFDWQFFEQFRSCNLVAAAVGYARVSKIFR